jgi:hypothetical protein
MYGSPIAGSPIRRSADCLREIFSLQPTWSYLPRHADDGQFYKMLFRLEHLAVLSKVADLGRPSGDRLSILPFACFLSCGVNRPNNRPAIEGLRFKRSELDRPSYRPDRLVSRVRFWG